MTTSDQMQRLRDVLDAFGADRSRWPDVERAALERFLAQSAEAQGLMAREAAFDRLLAWAPDAVSAVSVEHVRSSLLAQVEAGAGATALPVVNNVIPMVRPERPVRQLKERDRFWRDLAVMAAALLVGFFSVSGGVLDGSRFDPAKLTSGLASDPEDVSAVALGGTEEELMQEEML